MSDVGVKVDSKTMTPDQVKEFLEAQVIQARAELKDYLKSLGHSQKERLIMAISEYPQEEADFSHDGETMVKAFSAMKRCFDTNVAYGVEDVLQTMQQEQLEAMKKSEAPVESKEEVKEVKPKTRKKKNG